MKLIYARGKYSHISCQVSDQDFDELSKYKWKFSKGGITKYGYFKRGGVTNGKYNSNIYMHREIMKDELALCPTKHIDHINSNTLDNTRENLRLVTQRKNLEHRGELNKNNTTGYRGVWQRKDTGKFAGNIMQNRKTIFRCQADTALDCHNILVAKRLELGIDQ